MLGQTNVAMPAMMPPAPAGAQVMPTATAEAGTTQTVASAFVDAFDALDEARFDAFRAEDATLFFPALAPAGGGGRIVG